MKKNLLVIVWLVLNHISVKADHHYLNRAHDALIAVVMEDIFTPPVASRVHVYPFVAAYEVLTHKYKHLKPLAGQISHLKTIPKPTDPLVNYSVAAQYAFIKVAQKLVYSEHLLGEFQEKENKLWLVSGVTPAQLKASEQYASQVATHIIEWLSADNYTYTRTLERYVLADSTGAWVPTAPEYMNALEPNWPLMRSMVSDKSNYVRAIPNIAYSEDKSSEYYNNAMKLYTNSLRKDSAHIKTAIYWDDNPNTAVVNGHLTYFIHKISPPGHWLCITSQQTYAKKLSEDQIAELFAMVSISLYEGFISCWAEKYISNAVRPETYINRLIDSKWLPLIETPPFPEYTSGHSVISAAAASMLTHYMPTPHRFTDSTQMYLSLPPRSFSSYLAAADEASVSRFYGGIHYMPALDNGNKQGKEVTAYILSRLHTR